MRHIVIGGSGFTGTTLARMLAAAGEEVVVFDLRALTDPLVAARVGYIEGDVRRLADVSRLPLDPDCVVYHLAARQFADAVPRRGRDEWFAEVNVAGTRNVVAAMQAAGASQIVFFSTDMTYGRPTMCPVPSSHPQVPIGPYGRSKLAAEHVLRSAPGLRPVIFRPRLILGPGRLGILGKLFRLIRAGLPVPMIGSGASRYQMVGVEDCVRAATLAAKAGFPPGPFNLGSADPPTTRALLEAVIAHAGTKSRLVPVPGALLKPILAGLDAIGLTLLYPEQYRIADLDILLDTSETRATLGWAPVKDDIEAMIAAYDAFVAAT